MNNDHTPPLYPVAPAEGGPTLSLVQPWEREFARVRYCRELVGIPDSEVLSPALSRLLVFVCDEAVAKAAAQAENWLRERIEELERQAVVAQSRITQLEATR